MSVLGLDLGYTVKYTPPPPTVYPSSRPNTDTFSITKHYNIEIKLSCIAQSTGQYFPILPSCRSNTENQLYQY